MTAPFFFSSRRRHTSCLSDWSSDVCSSDLSFRLEDARELGFSQKEVDEPRARDLEIGRASCRERVESSGVGVARNKKKISHRGSDGVTAAALRNGGLGRGSRGKAECALSPR